MDIEYFYNDIQELGLHNNLQHGGGEHSGLAQLQLDAGWPHLNSAGASQQHSNSID